MARVDNGILTLTQMDAAELAQMLDWIARTKLNLSSTTKDAATLLAQQLVTMKDRDPFLGRRFVVEVEQDVKRC